METVKQSVAARNQGRREDEQVEHKAFYGRENPLYDTIMIDTCHMYSSKCIEYTLRVNSNVWTLFRSL